jgi:ABC-type nitrate/sulfonate/bicarbonate transport system permease component
MEASVASSRLLRRSINRPETIMSDKLIHTFDRLALGFFTALALGPLLAVALGGLVR